MPRPGQLNKHAQHDARNLEAARVILQDPGRYGGERAALVEWAGAIVSKSGKSTSESEQEAFCLS
jgi:hypothetical protein